MSPTISPCRGDGVSNDAFMLQLTLEFRGPNPWWPLGDTKNPPSGGSDLLKQKHQATLPVLQELQIYFVMTSVFIKCFSMNLAISRGNWELEDRRGTSASKCGGACKPSACSSAHACPPPQVFPAATVVPDGFGFDSGCWRRSILMSAVSHHEEPHEGQREQLWWAELRVSVSPTHLHLMKLSTHVYVFLSDTCRISFTQAACMERNCLLKKLKEK